MAMQPMNPQEQPTEEDETGKPPVRGSANVDPDKVSFMFNRAMEVAYERGFEQLVEMFKSVGRQGFARQMSTAVNALLDLATQEAGEPPTDEEALAVGTLLIAQIYADLIEGGIMQEDDALLQTAMVRSITEYMDKNKDKFPPERLKEMQQEGGGAMGQQMGGLLQAAQQRGTV